MLTHIHRVFVQTQCHKLFEDLSEVALEFWRVAFGDEEEDSHGVEVSMWRLSLGQLDGCDPQRPDVRLRRQFIGQ